MNSHFALSVFHLLIVVPLFLAIGFMRSATPNWLYLLILSLGIIIFLYHLYKFIIRLKLHSTYAWVNAIHVLAVAPLLVYIGYNKKETPRFAYELLLMLAFAAGGYHMYSLIKELNTNDKYSQ